MSIFLAAAVPFFTGYSNLPQVIADINQIFRPSSHIPPPAQPEREVSSSTPTDVQKTDCAFRINASKDKHVRETTAGEIFKSLAGLSPLELHRAIDDVYEGMWTPPEGWSGTIREMPRNLGSTGDNAINGDRWQLIVTESQYSILALTPKRIVVRTYQKNARELRPGDKVRVYGKISDLSAADVTLDFTQICIDE